MANSKIIKMTASNVKRIIAVEILPPDGVVIIGGNNASGKSSLLDAIQYALGGTASIPAEAVRHGEGDARVVIETDDFVVSRRITSKGSYLTIKNRDGSSPAKPQSVLDQMVGPLAFDPMAFMSMSAAKQGESLLETIGVDVSSIDQERKDAFEERTLVGRELRTAEARVGSVEVDESLPASPVDVDDLVKEIRIRESVNADIKTARVKLILAKHDDEISTREVSRSRSVLNAALAATVRSRRELDEIQKYVDTLGAPLSTDDIAAKISDAKRVNKAVNDRALRDRYAAEASSKMVKYEELSKQIASCDEQKNRAYSDAKYPIDGLGVDTDGCVRYQGVPMKQASQSDQIKVAVSIRMASKPKLRIVLIRDGSLLDSGSMGSLREIASEHDAQVWIERVGDGDEGAIVIEDGTVR